MSADEKDDDNIVQLIRDQAVPRSEHSVGYGKPPLEHQFKKGVSANPKGRPKKSESAWTERQLNAEILEEAFRMVPIKTNGKITLVSMFRLNVRRVLTDGAQGHLPSAKYVIESVGDAVAKRAITHKSLYDVVEDIERDAVLKGHYPSNHNVFEMRNYWRKRTRKD
jgi:hypothetical protein